ncbi:MAG: hypothetical protein IPL32_13725 [Chloracidobacterium sp.]|nr:hypothetical protein [Chloracidobacterium sp.]
MKKTITTITLAAIMTLGTTFANAGIIVAGRGADNNTCSQSKDGIIVAGRDGIIVAGLTGIIVAGLTGIIVAGLADTDTTPCTTSEKDGIIVAG